MNPGKGPGAVNTDANRLPTGDRPLVDLQGVTVHFGDVQVLAPTNVQVHRGEFLTLYGPSGCGKSTLLNMTAGLLQASSGQVLFNGQTFRGVNTNVGYMTQDDTLLPWRTLRDNVTLPLRMRGVDKATIQNRADKLLRMLDLAHAANRFPIQLSGGMKRRALLARSMIYEPEMLLMDEPFAAVDATLRDELHVELRATIERTNQTVLFVTHDVHEAVLLSDRVLVLGGRPSTVVDEYEIPFGRNRDISAIRNSEELMQIQAAIRDSLDRGAVRNG